jgi:hypothetical protein
MELSFDRNCFTDSDEKYQIELSLTTHTIDGEITYPRQGTIKIKI